jgi:hypothetical protein
VRNGEKRPVAARKRRNGGRMGGWVEISDLVHHLTFLHQTVTLMRAVGPSKGVVNPGGAWWCQARARRLQKAMRKFWLLRTRQRDLWDLCRKPGIIRNPNPIRIRMGKLSTEVYTCSRI